MLGLKLNHVNKSGHWQQMGIRPSVNNHNDCDFDYNVTWNPSCNMVIRSQLLTHLPLVCVGELGQHWFRKWLVAWSVASHYLNQCLGTNFSEMQIRNAKLFIHQNALRNVILEMAATLTGGGVCVCVCGGGGGGGGGDELNNVRSLPIGSFVDGCLVGDLTT